MNILYIFLCFFSLICFDSYLKINIMGIGEGSLGLPLLFLFIVIGFFSFLWRISLIKSLLVRRSSGLLALFFIYFIFRIVIDIGSIDVLKAFTVATSSGVILFYTLGVITSILISGNSQFIRNNKNYFNYYIILLIIYISFSSGTLLKTFVNLGSEVRNDLFLTTRIDGLYQRAGNFLIISFLIIATLYAQYISLAKSIKCSKIIINILLFILFLPYLLVSIMLAQLVASNNATITIFGIGIIVISLFLIISKKKFILYLSRKPLKYYNLFFSKMTFRFFQQGFFSLFILIFFIFTLTVYFGIDLSTTRIFGYGSGELSSLNSRLTVLENFGVHFEYSPFFGNMLVDNLTTGQGTYVHSLPLKLLTHTGILGFLLFFIYLYFGYKELLILGRKSFRALILSSNIINIFSFSFLSFVLLISVIATSFISASLWFSLGLFLVVFNFKLKNENN